MIFQVVSIVGAMFDSGRICRAALQAVRSGDETLSDPESDRRILLLPDRDRGLAVRIHPAGRELDGDEWRGECGG